MDDYILSYLEEDEIRNLLKDAANAGFSVVNKDKDRVLQIKYVDNSIGVNFVAKYDTASRSGSIRLNHNHWINNSGREDLDAESWLLCVRNIANQILEIIN